MPTSTINYNRPELNAIIDLDELLIHFPPLLALAIAELRKKAKDLDISLIAGKSESDWVTIIETIPADPRYPDQYKSSTNPVQDYAHDIAYRITLKYPAAAIASQIGSTKIPTKDALTSILQNNPGFDVSMQAAHTWFTVVGKPAKPNEITSDDLKNIQELQRCIKLTEGAHKLNQVEALMLSGITSAYGIYTMGKHDFGITMKQYGLADSEINFIICRAKSIYDTVNYLSVQHIRYDGQAALLPAAAQYGTWTSPTPLQIPDMESMFGSMNSCSCADCQSVFSPAAYYTDMLHWLKSDVVDPNTGINAYSVLTGPARRPDLPFIKLNCNNTNTVMPYIDLVNEILSINLLPSPAYTLLQTVGNTADLMNAPEHRFTVAEALLKTAYFPWGLPYDADHSESVRYLTELGLSYADLIKAFDKPADKYSNKYWAQAYLNLNDSEYQLITSDNTADANFWTKYWGMATAPSTVGVVLRSASVQPDELNDLLGSAYITNSSPGAVHTITVVPPASDDCNIDAYTFSAPFSIAIADRFMRFFRLRRKCSLSVWELDLAIKNFGTGINDNFIINLSSSLAFCAQYNISFADLMLCYNENPYHDFVTATFVPSQYYQNRFLNPLLPADIVSFFTPGVTGTCYGRPMASLTDADKQKVATVLNIGIADVELVPQSGTLFDQVSLGKYNRYAILSNAIGIPISEMIMFLGFAGSTFPTTVTAAGLWTLVNLWNDFKKLNLMPSALSDICLGNGYYGLNSAGQAINIDFDAEAQKAWQLILKAVGAKQTADPATVETDYIATVVQQLSASLNLPIDLITPVISAYSQTQFSADPVAWYRKYIPDQPTTSIPNPPYPRNAAWSDSLTPVNAHFMPAYKLLKRILALCQTCGLDADGIEAGVNTIFGSSNQLVYPIANAFYWFTDNYSSPDINRLVSIKKATLQAAEYGISQADYFSQISSLQGHTGSFSDSDIESFAGGLYTLSGADSVIRQISQFEFGNVYFRAQSIATDHKSLLAVMEVLMSINNVTQTIGSNSAEIWSWVWIDWPVTGPSQHSILETYKDDLRRVLRNRYTTDDAWGNYIIPIQNSFRDNLRDALVAYYIGVKGFKDSNALYDHFLLDTEMEACMKTSRLVLAISAVQLLVERALMGLEPDVDIDEKNKAEWSWRKNYRVWEANRKIFLYPENWIVPTLRLDKSPFFKDSEDMLLQDDITDDNCEKAYSAYLTSLHEVSRLDIRGTYVDEESDPHILHVFGRTWNAPYIYYYRNRENDLWSSWQKLELDIDGDHIIPIIFNRRLYLIWPMFVSKEHRQIKRVIDGVEQNAPYYEIKLCYSKLEFGKWTNKKILDGTMYAGQISGKGVYNDLEKKLGKGIPGGSVVTVPNPNYNPCTWNVLLSHGAYMDPYAPDGPLKLHLIPGETYRGNLVWDNVNFQDYSYVDLDQKSFFFYGDIDTTSGDLTIHCRRDFDTAFETWHLGYEELAYEDCFRISACDEKVEIIPAIVSEQRDDEKRFLARPFLTLPDGMLLAQGLDRPDLESPNDGLFVKKNRTYYDERTQLFRKTHPSYTLTYPHQYKDAIWDAPFFFSDKRHTFFLERGMDKRCVCSESIVIVSGGSTSVPATPVSTGTSTASAAASLVAVVPGADATSATASVLPPGKTVATGVSTAVVAGSAAKGVVAAPLGAVTVVTNTQTALNVDTVTQVEISCSYTYFTSGKFVVIPHEHPHTCTMLSEFNRYGITGLLDSNNPDIRRQLSVHEYFASEYQPVPTYINSPYPAIEYDFKRAGAYSLYNWEVFFHMVSTIARQLKENGKYEQAIKWLQYVFDPTNRESAYGIQRVWKIKPFMADVTNGSIQYMMSLLSSGSLTPDEEAKRDEFIAQIDAWRANPFEPHLIAEMRPRAYMLWTVLEYIDTLIDWGDSLFRQDTMESINEATNLYILASKLLGDRPTKIAKSTSADVSFNQIASGLDTFSNVAINMENQMTGVTFPSNCTCSDNAYQSNTGYSLPNLLFCIPDNPNLLDYWNRVEDRLFNIRHCRNIDGIVQDIPLFQPPIDPALLVRATALGLDISDVLADLAAPSPHYRFSYLLQKATDFCNEAKSLGGQLLAALEKKDAEELTVIRQLHEQNILSATRNLKKMQIDEAKQAMATLEHSKNLIQIRLSDYQSRAYVSSREQKTIDFTKVSEDLMYVEQGANLISSVVTYIPDPYVGFPSNFVKLIGGAKISYSAKLIGEASGIIGSVYRNKASMSSTYAGYDRRQEDWNLQIKSATAELDQVEVQLLGAQIRVAITEKELDNHELQMEQSQEIYDWVRAKFTNQQLYSWMSGELMKLHHNAYGLAYDMAKLTQNAFKKELTGDDPQIIQFGNWDSGRKGLLAGDRLSSQLKELESNYMKLNTREFELTKTISVKLLDPDALVNLIMNGTCNITLPDWLFNLEFQDKNLYALRLKSIAVSLPCITGPQTSTNVKLKMLTSSILWQTTEPPIDYVVNEEIITSTSVNDPAVFEMNLRDERYMPFENQGVVSSWQIDLPNQHEFDYSTISDLVLHIRYVAKGKNSSFPSYAYAPTAIPPHTGHRNAKLLYTHQFMSLRHDFPMDWQRIISNATPSIVSPTVSPIIPLLTSEYIPYKVILAGVQNGNLDISNLYYLCKNTDNEMVVVKISNTEPVTFVGGDMKIGGVTVEDIWMIYDYA